MKVELAVGEAVTVSFAGTDGEITVAFSDRDIRILTGCDSQLAMRLNDLGGIVVHTDLPDTAGRGDIIYHEPLGVPNEKEGIHHPDTKKDASW